MAEAKATSKLRSISQLRMWRIQSNSVDRELRHHEQDRESWQQRHGRATCKHGELLVSRALDTSNQAQPPIQQETKVQYEANT